jgi:hypothetical protein
MKLGELLRGRRQKAARRRYEREKAARERNEDFEKKRERVKGAAGMGGGIGGTGA